ncbi:hypothetical protein [Zobellella denitrificans]|uniref:hypothetical protein n=1 Tax=Zobellella denitrificans TaxID=347534 RepID=UPI0012FD2335|nr:hypothetical protein [Zobellella denitrificans]
MANIVKLWAGRVYGTNTGNLFMELNASDGEVSGVLRFMDSAFGLTVYRLSGSFEEQLRLHGEVIHVPEGVDAGPIDVIAILTEQGNLRGEWKSEIGTAGTFEAYSHDVPPPNQRVQNSAHNPEQLYTSHIVIGAIRLYAEDLKAIIERIKRDFVIGWPVVTYSARDSEVTKYWDDFSSDYDGLRELKSLKLMIQEPDTYGINKVVSLELSSFGKNEIRVQGVNESWVVGKAEAISRILKTHEKVLVTNYKKFGLTLNQFIFLAMLVLIPAIGELWQRASFVLVVLFLLGGLYWLHSRFIPNTVIYLTDEEPTFIQRFGPSILSWVGAVAASLAAALIFYFFTGNAI